MDSGPEAGKIMAEASHSSYRQILKSSALIGGSSVVTVFLNIVRTKVLAVFIGPSGLGLFGAFSSVTGLVGVIGGMGISTSGVRQISEAVGSNDSHRIAQTALVLRRTSLVMGLLGMGVLAAFSGPISRMTFGTAAYAGSLVILSLTVLFTEVAAGQMALIQGMRKIRDLAALTIWGALWGTLVSIPLVYFFRERGIVRFFVSGSALGIAASWWYARKIKIQNVPVPPAVVWREGKALLGLGVVFMSSGLMVSAVGYIARVLVIREIGLNASGLYQAALALSTTYVGFVMSAMGADYFPRLTAVAHDHEKINRLANEQAEATLLLAVPGILATLTFAPWVMRLMYSSRFEPAVEILRWQLLGIFGRVLSWPLGFILPAKGSASVWFWTEFGGNAVHLALIFLGLKIFGLDGVGIAFFGQYVVYLTGVYFVVRRLTGFQWTPDTLRVGIAAALAVALVFAATSHYVAPPWGIVTGSVATTGFGIYSLRKMANRSGVHDIRGAWKGLLARVAPSR
jgi:antigen flippase